MLSDYELAYLIGETSLNTQMMAMNAFSIISAYLLVAHLFGSRLSWLLVGVLTMFYAFALLVQGFAILKHGTILASVVQQLQLRGADSTLAWHPSNDTSVAVMEAIPPISSIAMVVIFLGSLWFMWESHRGRFVKHPG